jgi:hypothetical protein
MSNSPVYHIYTSFWQDESKGRIAGLTLTLPENLSTALLIFLGLMVVWTGNALWRLGMKMFLRLRIWNTPWRSKNFLFWQKQLVLANNGCFDTCWILINMWIAWSKYGPRDSNTRNPKVRGKSEFLWVIVMSALFVSGFTIASVMVYKTNSDSYRLVGVGGFIDFDNTNEGITSLQQSRLDNALSAKSYAKRCYGTGSNDCSSFRVPDFPYSRAIGRCPFFKDDPNQGICKAETLQLSTSLLRSADHLGINAPMKNQILFRKRLTCAPVETKQFESMAGDILVLNMGSLGAFNATFLYNTALRSLSLGYQLQ